jgi:hypothetical protein
VISTEPKDLILKTEAKSIYSLFFLALILLAFILIGVFFGVFRKDNGSMIGCFAGALTVGTISFFGLKGRVFAEELRLSKTSLTANFLNWTKEIPLSQITGLVNQKGGGLDCSIINLQDGHFIYIPGSKRAREMLEAISEATGLPIAEIAKRLFT